MGLTRDRKAITARGARPDLATPALPPLPVPLLWTPDETPSVILVGFGYWGTANALPGTVVDLYRMATLARDVLHTNNVLIISDITVEETVENLRQVILEGDLATDVMSFVKEMTARHQWVALTPRLDLDTFIRRMTVGKGLVYFSGHGRDGYGIFPDGRLWNFDTLLASVGKDSRGEWVFIVDCCHTDTFGLPFTASPDLVWIRNNYGLWYGRVLVLASSAPDETSTTSQRGSSFTRELCAGIRAHFGLVDLLKSARSNSSAVFNASFPCALDLFDWMRPDCLVRQSVWGGYVLRKRKVLPVKVEVDVPEPLLTD